MIFPRLPIVALGVAICALTAPVASAAATIMNPATAAASALIPAAQQQAEDGRGQSLFTKEWHAERRQALMETFLAKATDKDAVIVLRGAGTQNDYREFRQDNNFWYFTGITTPNAVYVCIPKTGKEYLLVPKVGQMEERWNGDRIDSREAKELTGIETCTSISKRGGGPWSNLEALLEKLAVDHQTIYVQKQPAENWMMSRDNLAGAKNAVLKDPFDTRRTRGGQFAAMLEEKVGVKTQDITLMIDNMRLKKTEPELEAMRRACSTSGKGHVAAMQSAKIGEYEWQLAARMTGAFLNAGGMGAGYMAIVGAGPNACILHYTENKRSLQPTDVVMIDYGAEYNHYVADISRTWPVAAKFTAREREVYEAVYAAQEAAFKACKPGATLSQVDRAAQAEMSKRGFGRMWHGTSHWLGMATHDVGAYNKKFEPGMVFTVEPGMYLPEEGFGVRIEDVVAITADGYEILSSSIPRHIDEIEALRASAVELN
jgi:Xaa-Pro aminopeptidase